MADNVAITAGSGTSIAADEVVDGTLGTVKVQYTKLMDGTLDGTAKAAVGQSSSAAALNVVNANNKASSLAKFLNAAFGTLTRPANTTAYAANDAVSNNGTAASVTAQTVTLSDTNDEPVTLDRLRVSSTDTGLSNVSLRAWLFNSDPTASSGVGGGDNAAFSQKKAGYIGTMSGTMRSMSDGAVGVLAPDEGMRIVTTPVSGARTIYILWQVLGAWTPSANSTTIDATVEGYQGRVG